MPAFREEIFGPVAPVIVVKDDAEAVAVRRDRRIRQRGPVRLAEQLGRVHPVALDHGPRPGARLPVLGAVGTAGGR